MSQQQPTRLQPDQEPIKYGDVFAVSGELASKPVAPQDAATMQSAENLVLGKTQKGGPAAVMQSAARKNEDAGVVAHDDATVARTEGVTITETDVAGLRVVTEAVGRQVVGQYSEPGAVLGMKSPVSAPPDRNVFTIGEALEASSLSAGDKPVEQSDAAAIQAAELRATGLTGTTPRGVAASAQSAAILNARTMSDQNKIKLADVLGDATTRLPADKSATPQDAERVIGAEIRNNPNMATHPGGVGASVATAARLNQEK